jgi:hypothetical protein
MQLWQPGQPVQSGGLKQVLEEYRWDYIVEGRFNGILSREWQYRFDRAITSTALFPENVCINREAVGWVPILNKDKNGKYVLSLLLALPPGTWKKNPKTHALVSDLLRQAAWGLFRRPRFKFRLACPSRLIKVLTKTVCSPEFVTTFVRRHHRKIPPLAPLVCAEPMSGSTVSVGEFSTQVTSVPFDSQEATQ